MIYGRPSSVVFIEYHIQNPTPFFALTFIIILPRKEKKTEHAAIKITFPIKIQSLFLRVLRTWRLEGSSIFWRGWGATWTSVPLFNYLQMRCDKKCVWERELWTKRGEEEQAHQNHQLHCVIISRRQVCSSWIKLRCSKSLVKAINRLIREKFFNKVPNKLECEKRTIYFLNCI